jgi:hypothetical protein
MKIKILMTFCNIRHLGNWKRYSIILIAVCILLGKIPAATVGAQAPQIKWSVPTNISSSKTESFDPAIVADPYGNVHIFWSEVLVNTNGASRGDTIMYRRWDGESWTSPADVLLVPDDYTANFIAVDVGPKDRLHAVWTGFSNIYYSSAPISHARSARAWREPIILSGNSARSQLECDIVADSTGTLHAGYAAKGNSIGVHYVQSNNDGKTWSLPTLLSEPLDDLEEGFSNVRLFDGNDGLLHVAWQTFQEGGYGQAVYYARSTDKGGTWTPAAQLAYREPEDFGAGWPYLATRGDSELHLIYLNGHGTGTVGRFHRVSMDKGKTWSESAHIIPSMMGLNGYVIPLVDKLDQMHLIINMRPRATQVTGIYYAYWTDSGWTQVAPVASESPYVQNPHRTDAVVRLGNELHVVYQNADKEIWHVWGIIDDIAPIEPQHQVNPTLPPTSSPVNVAETGSAASPTRQMISTRQPNYQQSPGLPVLVGTTSAFLFVVATIILSFKYSRRKNH